jgi:hypothetical protein
MKPPKRITPQWLSRHRFCAARVRQYKRYHEKGLNFTTKNVKIMQRCCPYLVVSFLDGCVWRNTSPDSTETCTRLTPSAVKQFGREVKKKFHTQLLFTPFVPTVISDWAERAGPKEIVHFCTWAMLNWKEGE